jgi:hypothetical protein
MHAEPNAIPQDLPEEDEPAVTPGDDSNDDPTPPLPVEPTGTPQRNPAVDRSTCGAMAPQDCEPGKVRGIFPDRRGGPHVSTNCSPETREEITMATDPNVPPPEPVQPLATPPNPGQVQPAPQPM